LGDFRHFPEQAAELGQADVVEIANQLLELANASAHSALRSPSGQLNGIPHGFFRYPEWLWLENAKSTSLA
jgi:hypothetical protein